jgi:glycosyltransferase involved in cell wall biosynthesis
MPHVSIIVPAYNTLASLPQTVASLLAQTFEDFEIIIVDDGSMDGTADWVAAQTDPRIRLFRQINRGLAGARNGGILAARGELIGFCDGDDLWEPEKLEKHVTYLSENLHIGVSYSASLLVNETNTSLGIIQRPRTQDVSAAHILMRNPVGNGSAPVIRAETLRDIAYRPAGQSRDWFFDETMRQSEDIECWVRIALTTRWQFGGIAEPLTRYRVLSSGLSANLERQFATWCDMADKVRLIAPGFAARHLPAAEAYQLRYLARRAISLGDGATALRLQVQAYRRSLHPLLHEPRKSLSTLIAAAATVLGGARLISLAMRPRVS